MVNSFEELIDLFDGPAAFAREVGMTPGAAKQAKRRDNLNARWFSQTVKAAERRQLPVTIDTLLTLAERSAPETRDAA